MIRHQTDLMKVGFDVVGIVNEALMQDQLWSFNPDLVIASGKSGKVSATSVAQKLKSNSRYSGSVILLLPTNQRPQAQELTKLRMDIILEVPTAFPPLLQAVTRLLRLDIAAIFDKYLKSRVLEGASAEELSALKVFTNERESRFSKALQGLQIDPKSTTFQKQDIKQRQESMKKDWDFKKLSEIDELKQQFVRAMFKKK